MNNIPYSIVKANKVEEYVEASNKSMELNSIVISKEKACRRIMRAIDEEIVIHSGRNYVMRDAANGMSWSDVLSLHEHTKELVEAKGQYEENLLKYKEANNIVIKIYQDAEDKYGNTKNV